MKLKRLIGTLLLSGALMISMSVPAFAADGAETPGTSEGSEGQPAVTHITKDFQLPEGAVTPEVTFDFTATSDTPGAPAAAINSIAYGSSDTNAAENGLITVSKTSDITFGEFPHAGEYIYKVKETRGSAEGVSYDSETEFDLHVYVANGSSGLYVKAIVADRNGEKQPIRFLNKYSETASISIGKQTVGDLADKTRDFDFTVTFTKSAMETAENPSYEGRITGSGSSAGETVTAVAGTPASFKLHDGERLVFDSLPVGTRCTVTEVGAQDGYTPSVKVIENRMDKGTTEFNETQDAAADVLVAENGSEVDFTNTYNDIALTGLIAKNLPFILLIGLGICVFGALAVIKRRRSSKSEC